VQQLTGLDAAFLAMETDSVFGHVGSVVVLDPSTAPEPLTLERLTALIERRLHLIPPFRRRLVTVPFGLDQPYWIEDPDFDLEYHVREIALPEPGNDRQLAYQAARLHARPLDRRRPLWEIYLIHGLEGGRKAVYSKVHHAAIDGVSGNDILAAVLDLTPEGRPDDDVPPWECDEEPGAARMLAKSAVSLAGHPLRAARMTYGIARSLPTLATSPVRPRLPVVDRLLRRDEKAVLSSAGLRAPRTPFNRPVGPHRRWAFCTVPLDDVKAVKKAAECTVNDVVMALSTGALRRWLIEHEALPSGPLVAAVPVSVRTDDQQGQGGNRVSTMMAPLPTHLADPLDRLRACHLAMQAAKQQHGALPADLLADVTQFAMPALAGQAARAAARVRLVERVNPFNLIVSNVPGPPIDLYYAGCKIVAYYPLSAIADGQGLNITVMSLAGGMHFGLIADRELVPDVDRMAQYLVDELVLLSDAVGARAPEAGESAAGTPPVEPAAPRRRKAAGSR
jgi:diacylglycerol O-acyltransferase / wax synthase